VLVVEDNEDIRFLLNVLSDLHPDIDVSSEATNAEDGLRMWREQRPDLVLLDYRLPGRDGLELAAEILAEKPDQRIVLFSAYLDDRTVARAEAMGINECISKDQIGRLLELIRTK